MGANFISADCWLAVFNLLAPSQLGLGIALISHRFDCYVDEHFKTRKWALGVIRIGSKIDGNGTKELEMANYDGKQLPMPQVQLARKITGFQHIEISYIDSNVIAFIHHFRPLFASCPINFGIYTMMNNDSILEFILRNIWPMIARNICWMDLSADEFHRMRKFVPAILSDCPLLRVVFFYMAVDFFTEFPVDDSAMASDGQAMAKWLFTPLPDDVPKVFNYGLKEYDGNWPLKIEAFKAVITIN
ncbi:hypothetical protein niasHT_023356 [Heterodera trifolii]|uniref:Uncharacterized protein n=2 Tax=Heterodera trifolii TaxID=157864 RepID=A0ABD2JYI5_9BILA